MTGRLLYFIGAILLIGTIAAGIIAYSRGYRLNFRQKTLTLTGILSASSTPDGASIFIDGKLTSATNASITLPPGWYQIRIGKEGYQQWEKRVRIQGELVSRVEALLIPTNPSLRTLTVMGVSSPALSPNGTKVAYIIPKEEGSGSATLKPKTGVWVLDLRSGPLGTKSEPKQVFQPVVRYDWQNAHLYWSPDEKKVMAVFYKKEKRGEITTAAVQLSVDSTDTLPTAVTLTVSKLLSEWQANEREKQKLQIANLPFPIGDIFTKSILHLNFSPDETKMLYLATVSASLPQIITPPLIGSNPTSEVRTIEKEKFYIYDNKEDKNYFIAEQKSIPEAKNLAWHSDSKHIIMIEKDTIYIMDYDGTNKRTVYSGPFAGTIAFPKPGGEKLIILTSLTKPPQVLPNFYEIDLR